MQNVWPDFGFSFLKIIFRHWIWNEIPENLERNCCFKTVFCLLFRNGFLEHVAIFLALVALKCICCVCPFENVSWAVVALKVFFDAFLFENFFLALIAAKIIFCSCRSENNFLLLLLWKLFLVPVALKNVCLSLTSLKMIFLFLSLSILFWVLVALKTFWHIPLMLTYLTFLLFNLTNKNFSSKIFLVKRWNFWTCFLITKGGWKKVHTHGKEFELSWRKLFCSKWFPFVKDVWNF